jgi:phage regulator Rha-like protein
VAIELFDLLEKKLENILNQFQSLKADNLALAKSLQEKEQALNEALLTIDKMGKERDLVRQRIDQLLNKVEALSAGGQE